MMSIYPQILIFFIVACYVQSKEYRICVSQNETDVCNQMAAEMKNVDNTLICVFGRDKIDCMRKVMNNEADILNLAANEAYVAALNFSLSPFVQEERDGRNDGVMYEAVAIVKKNSGIRSLSDLKLKRSCHTGFGRNAGWSIPISILRASDIMGSDCDELAATSKFFTDSCIPGPWTADKDMNSELATSYENLCSLCKSKCQNPSDEYIGYEGALKCLTETQADVAFTKLSAARTFFATHPSKSDYQFLCLNGTTLSMDSAACSWASRPNNVIVTRKNMTEGELTDLRTGLLQIFSRFQSPSPPWLSKIIISNSSVTSLSVEKRTITEILDKHNYRITIDKPLPKLCKEKYIHFCVTSKVELEKCQDFKVATFAQLLRPQVECSLQASALDCFKAIRDGQSDVIAVDSGEVFLANEKYNLVPVMSENYGELNASYYAVAVIHSKSNIMKLEDLKGKKSCHTGFRRTAGWNVPAGTLKSKGLIKEEGCKIQDGVAKFFSKSCVPGVKGLASLCKLCVGNDQGSKVCDASSEERYYGYSGAFRCLAEAAGDVAFVKHTTVGENLGPIATRPEWAKNLQITDFSLLCLEGRTDSVENYRQCNWAQVASHKLLTNGKKNKMEVMSIKMMFLKASSVFGPTKSLFKLFGSYREKKDLLFKDSATSLQAVPSYASIQDVLGKELYEDLNVTFCPDASGANIPVSLTFVLALCLVVVFLEQHIWAVAH